MMNERGSLAVLLVAVLFLSVPASGAAAASLTTDGSTHTTGVSDGTLADIPEELNETAGEASGTGNETTDAVNETADGVDDGVNETADGVDEGVNETGDGVDEGVHETGDGVDEGVHETTDGVDDGETSDDVEDAVDETSESAADAADEVTDDAADIADSTSAIVEEGVDETTDAVERTTADATTTVDGVIDPSGADLPGEIEQLEAELSDTVETLNGTTTTGVADSPLAPGAGDQQSSAPRAEEVATIDATSNSQVSEVSESDADTQQEANSESDPAEGNSRAETAETESDDDGGGSPIPGGSSGAGVAIGAVVLGAVLVARDVGTAAALSAISASGSSLLATIAALLRDWITRLFALFGYKRYSDDDPLEHETRERLYEYIRSSPGSYLAEISEETDVPMQTARYHLRILDFENLVDHESIRGRRRYVPLGTDCAALDAALNDDATAQIIRTLDAEGPDSVSGLADRLDRDPSTISHHLDRLAEDDLVERERDGRAVVNRLTSDAERALGGEATAATDARVPSQAD
jgi:predicted transcriptional regulator